MADGRLGRARAALRRGGRLAGRGGLPLGVAHREGRGGPARPLGWRGDGPPPREPAGGHGGRRLPRGDRGQMALASLSQGSHLSRHPVTGDGDGADAARGRALPDAGGGGQRRRGGLRAASRLGLLRSSRNLWPPRREHGRVSAECAPRRRVLRRHRLRPRRPGGRLLAVRPLSRLERRRAALRGGDVVPQGHRPGERAARRRQRSVASSHSSATSVDRRR